jgi:hypothetical protein
MSRAPALFVSHGTPVFALGAGDGAAPRRIVGGMRYGVLSMDAFGFGMPADEAVAAS